jgi:hypothetical protein
MSEELENDVKLEWRENEDGCWEYGAVVDYGEFESHLGIELVTLLEGTVGQHEGWCVTHDHENDGWFGPLYATREEAMEACVRVHDALYPQFIASLRARPQEPGEKENFHTLRVSVENDWLRTKFTCAAVGTNPQNLAHWISRTDCQDSSCASRWSFSRMATRHTCTAFPSPAPSVM